MSKPKLRDLTSFVLHVRMKDLIASDPNYWEYWKEFKARQRKDVSLFEDWANMCLVEIKQYSDHPPTDSIIEFMQDGSTYMHNSEPVHLPQVKILQPLLELGVAYLISYKYKEEYTKETDTYIGVHTRSNRVIKLRKNQLGNRGDMRDFRAVLKITHSGHIMIEDVTSKLGSID